MTIQNIIQTPLGSIEDFNRRIEDLDRIETQNPFRNTESQQVSFRDRLSITLQTLADQGVDIDAVRAVFASTLYVSSREMNGCWRTAFDQLKKTLKEDNHEAITKNAAFFQCDNEDHITAFVRANVLEGRQDPERFSYFNTVQRLEDLRIDSSHAQSLKGAWLNAVKSFLNKRIWILLWDLNLSGRTVATELRRLKDYAKVYCAKMPEIYLCCAISTNDALKIVGDKLDNQIGIISGDKLESNYENLLTPLWVDRVQNLCIEFFDKYILRSSQDDLVSYVKKGGDAFGYKSGKWTLVTEDNCPNNSLPILWLNLINKNYVGPFPRIPSRVTHLSLAPKELDDKPNDYLISEENRLQTYFYIQNCIDVRPDHAVLTESMCRSLVFQIISGASSSDRAEQSDMNQLVDKLANLEICADKLTSLIWKDLLNETDLRLQARERDLPTIQRLIDVLERLAGKSFFVEDLTKKQQLLYDLSKLRYFNHYGEVEKVESYWCSLEEIEREVSNDDPSLALYSSLNRAVSAMNCFDFEKALSALVSWRDDPRFNGIDAEYRGAYWSSLGQISAFKLDFTIADSFFDKAKKEFLYITDLKKRDKNIDQTSVYQAINRMDGFREDIRPLLREIIGYQNICSLPGKVEPRYHHHLLVRALFSRLTELEDMVQDYLLLKDQWSDDQNHPYPLINMYRALLLNNMGCYDEARNWLNKSIQQTVFGNSGMTLKVIGIRIATIGWHLNLFKPDTKFVDCLFLENTDKFPHIYYRIEKFKKLLNENPRSQFVEEITSLLPFNYH